MSLLLGGVEEANYPCPLPREGRISLRDIRHFFGVVDAGVQLAQLLLFHRLPAGPSVVSHLARRVRRQVALQAQEEARVFDVDLRILGHGDAAGEDARHGTRRGIQEASSWARARGDVSIEECVARLVRLGDQPAVELADEQTGRGRLLEHDADDVVAVEDI